MLKPRRSSHPVLDELRADLKAADAGRLRLGILVLFATVGMVASGWPPDHPIMRGISYVLAVIPMALIGGGLIVGSLIEARAERRSHQEADDREFAALRASIEADRALRSGEPVVEVHAEVEPVRVRKKSYPPRRLVRRRGEYRVFQTRILTGR